MASPIFESVSTNTTAGGTTSNTVATPAGTTDGDYLIALCSGGSPSANFTAPAGWTSLAAAGGCAAFGRTASSEGASREFTRTGSTTGVFVISVARFSGVDSTTPVADSVAASSEATTALEIGGVTATQGDTLVMGMVNAHIQSGSVTPPTGYAEHYDDTTTGEPRVAEGASVVVGVGTTSADMWTPSVFAQIRGVKVAINPLADPTLTLAATLPRTTASLAFDYTPPSADLALDATLPGLAANLSLDYTPPATFALDATLPPLAADLAFDYAGPVGLDLDARLPGLTAALGFDYAPPAVSLSLDATLPGLAADLAFTVVGAPDFTLALDATLPAFGDDAVSVWFDYDPPVATPPPVYAPGRRVEKAAAYPMPVLENGRIVG